MGKRVARERERQIQETMVAFRDLVDQQGVEAVRDGDHHTGSPMPKQTLGRYWWRRAPAGSQKWSRS